MATAGATASRTVMATGAASTVWFLVSLPEARMRMLAPGAAAAGTTKPKVSVRSALAGWTERTAASCGWPVSAR